uniref:Core Histone H2A/H2B/H3 domain-containing protein n=1 Tax=Glossina brevipalpis TaxID=37001 RepID=A0A1A9WIS7_9MUSC
MPRTRKQLEMSENYGSLGDSSISSNDEQHQPSTSTRARGFQVATKKSQPQSQKTGSSRRKKTNPRRRDLKFLREVKRLQMSTDFMIPRLPFSRLVREIIILQSYTVTRITATAFEALQTASEVYLQQRMQDAYMLTLHRKCVTLDLRDMRLLELFRKNTS